MIVEFKKGRSYKKSPLLQKMKVILPLFLVFIVACFLFLDKPFALFCQNLESGLHDPLLLLNSLFSPFFALLIFPSLFFFTRFLQKHEKRSRKFLLFSLSISLSVLATSILQVIVGRSDPEWLFLHKEIILRLFNWDPSFHSFPSSTSANIAAIAISWRFLDSKKSLPFVLLALALVPALAAVCFLSDALVGLAIGLVVSFFVQKTMKQEIVF